jgi:hypothetical protein
LKTLVIAIFSSLLTISAYANQFDAEAGASCTASNLQRLRQSISATLSIYEVEYASEVFEYCAENSKDKRVRHLALVGIREAANRKRVIDDIFRNLP